MEETPGSHSLLQVENPLLCFFCGHDAMLLSQPHTFNIVSNGADRFVVRCQACEWLYLDIEQTGFLKESIQLVGDAWLTHAIITKTEEPACHVRIGVSRTCVSWSPSAMRI